MRSPSQRSKYGATRTTLDGYVFASKAEARRYVELKLLEKAGEIRELELQPEFALHAPQRGSTRPVQICVYRADFRYREGPDGLLVIEDVKGGVRTAVYRLKKKWVEAQYGISVTEVSV